MHEWLNLMLDKLYKKKKIKQIKKESQYQNTGMRYLFGGDHIYFTCLPQFNVTLSIALMRITYVIVMLYKTNM